MVLRERIEFAISLHKTLKNNDLFFDPILLCVPPAGPLYKPHTGDRAQGA